MKRFNHTIGFFAAAALAACTGDFESFNTNPDAVQSVDKKTYITTMQMDAVIPCSDVGANEFQRACNLMGDAFGGYLSPIQAFNGGSYTCTYDLDGTDYNNVPFSQAQVMASALLSSKAPISLFAKAAAFFICTKALWR